MEENKEVIYIAQNFRITKGMSRKIADYSKKMGEGNKSEFLRTAVNFLIAYFENKDFFEMLEKEVLNSLIKYEMKKIITLKRGEHSLDLFEADFRRLNNIPGAKEKKDKVIEKMTKEGFEELREKFADFIEEN